PPAPPTPADEPSVHRDPLGREVLAVLAGRQRPADPLFPPPCVLDGVGVDRLIGPPVCLAIRLVVSGEVDAPGCDPTDGGCFPDRTPGRAAVVVELAHGPDVDGEDLSSGSRHEPPSFHVRRTPSSAAAGAGAVLTREQP